jgi:hypothetical protein
LIAGIAHKLNEGGHVPFSIVDGLRPRSVPGRLGAFLEECNKPDGGHATILWPNILSLANDSQVISAIGNLPEGVRLIYTWPEDVPFEEPKDMLDAVKSDTDALATALVNRKLVCHKVASPKEERLTVAGRVIHDNARVNLFTYLGYSGTTSKHPRVMRRDRFADPRNVSMRY